MHSNQLKASNRVSLIISWHMALPRSRAAYTSNLLFKIEIIGNMMSDEIASRWFFPAFHPNLQWNRRTLWLTHIKHRLLMDMGWFFPQPVPPLRRWMRCPCGKRMRPCRGALHWNLSYVMDIRVYIYGGFQSHGGTPNHPSHDHDLVYWIYWNHGDLGIPILGKPI